MKRTLLAVAIGAISAGLVGGALAQDNEAELNDDAAMGEEQAAETQQAQEERERLEEEQDASADQEEQDAAADEEDDQSDVSVDEEELPDEGADAEDYEEVREEEAENGDQADMEDPEADGDEEMQTDPGEQATSAEPAAEQAPDGEQEDQAGQAAQSDTEAGFEEMEPAGASLDPSIASMQVSEIEGMTIVNAEGETLGQVENVLRHDDAGDLHAVVSVGGFWIFGGSEVALPLADMQLEGEQLVLQDTIGQDELDGLASDYDEDRYSEVDGDMTLSDAMGR
ncbi:PRC-barrel domain-containing protein [Halomonas sp. A29]|uniref:PRC-barrel domain-containing protein n=1 Tax=Halomonas sp. A29 TaxID=3102786 RepID=UPI00398A5ABC